MPSTKVMVLGCGPAGLVAAHAAAVNDCDVRIFSKPRKSYMKGAQYLHESIPFVPSVDEFTISYNMWGTPQGYRTKVYGPSWDGTVSPEDLTQTHQAWDIRQTYDWLWETYGGFVYEAEIVPGVLRGLLDKWKPDICMSTVPAPALCHAGHQFRAAQIYSTDNCSGVFQMDTDNTVVCNGLEAPLWYRASRIQGWENMEWSSFTPKPPIVPMWDVTKPLSHNCDCFPDVVRAGRYGKWQKGVLSHEAFKEMQECVHTL